MLEQRAPNDRESWLETIDASLVQAPHAVPLLFERAKLLDALGRDAEAEAAYRLVLSHTKEHFGAWNDLGLLLVRKCEFENALEAFRNAVAAEPDRAIGHANLGYILLRGGDYHGAKSAYARALALNPENIEAHRGLSIALNNLGEVETARTHREQGFAHAAVTRLPFRGTGTPVPLLLLVSESSANVPLERLIDTRVFLIHKLVVEFAEGLAELPEHAVVVNAVGDVDASLDALIAANRVVARSPRPVINPPDVVAETSRVNNATRLARIPGVRTAHVRRVGRNALLRHDAPAYLTSLQLGFPLLVRSLGYHTGEHFVRVDDLAALASAVEKLPGEELLAMEFLDLRNEKGTFTKYRMMIVGGAMYPLHAATSHDWKVHYFSAAMSEDAANRAIDEAFLTDPAGLLGRHVITGLAEVAAALRLGYGGIDFAVDQAGNLAVFEANATMVVARPGSDPMWDYRRRAVADIDQAVHRLLLETACIAQPA